MQEGIESLKIESEHLQRVDDTIRRQREQLRSTFDEFERKQDIFNEKGSWFTAFNQSCFVIIKY